MSTSVIIPAYNAAATIGAQIEALLRQMDADSEIIVSDNGSTDETAAVIHGYAFSDPRIRLVDSSGTKGPAHARNVGIRQATGDRILFCDADDEAGDNWFTDMNKRLADECAVSGALHKFTVYRGQRIEKEIMSAAPNFYGIPWPVSASLAIRRSTVQQIGGFDESLRSGEDIDLGIRLHLAGIPLAFEPSKMHYRMRDSAAAERRQLCVYSRWQVILEQRYAPLLRELDNTVPDTIQAIRDLVGHLHRTPSVLREHGASSWWTWTRTRIAKLQGHLDWDLKRSAYTTARPGFAND
ncbi:MAG: glycosyltransferase family 2 protein [Bifidobacterium crudilactis]|nr:glycosyltransferase family 2 protein [Bifidobacterium crudilactis]